MRLVSWKTGNAFAVGVMAIVIGQISAPVTGAAHMSREASRPEQSVQPGTRVVSQSGAPEQPPPQQQTAAAPVAEAASPRSSPARPEGPNIRVEITISDQVGAEPPLKKTLSVIAANHGSGAIRSTATVAVPTFPPGPTPKDFTYERLPLNVDIKPEVMKDGLISAQLTLNYETYYATKTSGMPTVRSMVTINQWVMLENGKPMVVSQSADATTDRKVTVELKATILR